MTELKHYDKLGTARFITFSCHNRYNLFNDDKTRSIFLRHLSEIRKKYGFKILAYVIMPSHVHIVIFPIKSQKIGKIIGELKSSSARELLNYFRIKRKSILNELKVRRNGKERFVFWQRRCYDHNCRGQSAVLEKINYCHNNPVNKKLVNNPGDWFWSSYDWYIGMGENPFTKDNLELNDPTASGGAPRENI